MKLKKIFGTLLLAITATGAAAANPDFNTFFADSTLRVDYVFGGGPGGIKVMLDSQSKQPGWAGRRHHLKEVPTNHNGFITVTDPATGDTIYRNTFSS
ncbi:MAG: peptidase M64, partial [Muribaculaceae bacterium]|nr:peptidase M64 [Muribaculaceae bacterium]